MNLNMMQPPAKARITLKTLDAVHFSINWSVHRNRHFYVVTNDLALGWSIEFDVLPDESLDKLANLFNDEGNNEQKTETPTS